VVQAYKSSVHNIITHVIMVVGALVTFFLFKTPWIFPILIVAGGFVTTLSSKRIPEKKEARKKIKWGNIWLFAVIFLLAGLTSELARKNNWPNRKPINLFENTYRFGSLVFGGGQVLMPMMYEQFVARPQSEALMKRNPNVVKVDKDDFYTGFGMVRAIPGPVFSVASFIGGTALSDQGEGSQVLGCVIGSVAIFLPSALLVLFFFPIWHNMKKYASVYRAMEGINAVVVGILISATFYMTKDFSPDWKVISANVAVIVGTLLILIFTKIPSPVIVFLCLVLGWFF
ncbi:MAG: chromate transporter, partial [Chitinophagales bacterium]